MLLENDFIKLRALEPEDLEILYHWENNTDLWIHGNTLSPYSRLALRDYITETQQQDIYEAKQIRFIIELKLDQTTIGTIDIYDFDFHNQRAGVGILIDTQYRRQNYGLQALELIKEYIFDFLRIEQLYAYISKKNNNSIRLFEKAGYTKSGTLKNWIIYNSYFSDVYIYQLFN